MCPEDSGKISEVNPASYNHGIKPRDDEGPGGVSTSPDRLGPVFMWSQQNYQRLLKTVR